MSDGSTNKIIALKLGSMFRRYREEELGVSLRTVADATGIHQSTIYRIESGDLTKPSLQDVVKLADFYKIPFNQVGDLVIGTLRKPLPTPKRASLQSLFDALVSVADDHELEHVVVYLQSYIRYLQTKHGTE